MGLSTRFITRSVWGELDPPPLAVSFGLEAWQHARNRPGAIRNLLFLGDKKDFSDKSDNNNSGAICLNYSTVADLNINRTSGYTTSDGTGYLRDYDYGKFQGTATGAIPYRYHVRFTSLYNVVTGVAETLNTITTEPIATGVNVPISLAFNAVKQAAPYVMRVESSTGELYQFKVKDSLKWMRLSSAWTQGKEDELNVLLALEEPTVNEENDINDLTAEIYLDETSISLTGETYGPAHTLVLIPENSGAITFLNEKREFLTRWQNSTLAANRNGGTLWTNPKLRVQSVGGDIGWQVRRLAFARSGSLRLGEYKTLTSGTWTYSLSSSVTINPLLPVNDPAYYVTQAAMANEVVNSIYDEVVVTLSTTDTTKTPFVYAGYAYRAPGVRSGYNSATTFDTDTLPENPLMEGTPTFEATGRRQSWQLQFRNANGEATDGLSAPSAFHYPAWENLCGDLWVKGVRVIRNGIIKQSGHEDMRAFTDNQLVQDVMKGATTTQPTLYDMWARLDEIVLRDVLPVGDGLTLGAYIRNCLALAGLHADEFAGVGTGEGRTLPHARPGEGWLVQPAEGATLGDWLRHLIDIYGMTLELWIDGSGVWQLGAPSTTVKRAIVSTTGADQMFEGGAMVRDTSDHWNVFRVEGALGADGRRLSAEWKVWASIKPSGGPGSRKYTGREIVYPTVRDEALVTQDDVNWAVRSLARKKSKPPRYVSGRIFYDPALFPGDRITADGVLCELTQLSGGSLAFGASTTPDYAGELSFHAREIE